jgi:hypothetical protein
LTGLLVFKGWIVEVLFTSASFPKSGAKSITPKYSSATIPAAAMSIAKPVYKTELLFFLDFGQD